MHKSRISFVLGALLASGLCLAEDAKVAPKGAAATATPAAPAAPAGTPTAGVNIATVNGVAYPLDLFRMFYMERLQETQSQNDPAFQQQAFNEFMTMVVASQEAKKRKLQDLPDVTAAIEVQRLKVMSNAALASIAQDFKATDEELKKAYEDDKKNAARPEFKVRHILVKDEATAKKIIKDLEKGADFGELAKKNSEVSTAKNDGGQLDWFDANSMPKPFAEAVAKMKPGTNTKEPVQTQFGWHVINLQETRTAEVPKFEDAKPRLAAIVQRQKLAAEVNKLREAAKVELNEEVVKVTPKTDAGAAAPAGAGTAAPTPAKKDEGKK